MHNRSSFYLGILGAVAVACTSHLVAQSPAPPPTIDIVECIVYPEGRATQTTDCAGKARAVCNGTPHCELPIGFALTDGRQIDGDARTWKKVRVRYRCGKVSHVNGPYNQSDHANMVLGCGAGT